MPICQYQPRTVQIWKVNALNYGSAGALERALPQLDVYTAAAERLNSCAAAVFEAVLSALWAALRIAEAYNDDPAVPPQADNNTLGW